MKHIKIILVPDQPYPGPAGCGACHYQVAAPAAGCGQPHLSQLLHSTCLTADNGGTFIGGGYFTIEASVSRNKREGKYKMRKYQNTYPHRPSGFSRGHHG